MLSQWLKRRRERKAAEREQALAAALAELDARWQTIETRLGELYDALFPEPGDREAGSDLSAKLDRMREAAEDEATYSRVYDDLVLSLCGRAERAIAQRRALSARSEGAKGSAESLRAVRHALAEADYLREQADHVTANLRRDIERG